MKEFIRNYYTKIQAQAFRDGVMAAMPHAVVDVEENHDPKPSEMSYPATPTYEPRTYWSVYITQRKNSTPIS